MIRSIIHHELVKPQRVLPMGEMRSIREKKVYILIGEKLIIIDTACS